MASQLPTPIPLALLDSSQQPRSSPAKLMVAIDYGTTKIDASCRIRQDGVSFDMNQIIPVTLGNKTKTVPQDIGFDKQGNFVWGDDLRDALADNRMDPEHVIRDLKLSLYKDHATSEIADRVKTHLQHFKISKETLLSLHLKALIEKAVTFAMGVCDKWSISDPTTIRQMTMEVFISVPEMWKPPANRLITTAAKMAGADCVQLVSEPVCAAAYYMQDQLLSKRTPLEAGDNILVLDTGGGTTDITCYEMPNPDHSNAGATSILHRVGKAVGGLCGSQFINEAFLKWLKVEADDHLGGFDNNVRRLGYSAQPPYTGFLKSANEGFTRMKHDFTPAKARSGTNMQIFIPSNPLAKTNTEDVWTVSLSCSQMKSFFDTVIDEIFQLMISQITPQTKRIIVPGGFGNSEYLHSELQTKLQPRYPRLRICDGDQNLLTGQQPISVGAVLRYPEIDHNALRRKGTLGLLRDEDFDKDKHPDGYLKAGEYFDDGGRRRRRTTDVHNQSVVKESPFTGVSIAYSRWDPILHATDSPMDRVTSTWQQRFIDVNDEEPIDFQVYWTDDPDMKQSSPVFEGDPDDGVLRALVEEWGPPILVPCPDFKKLKFHIGWTEGTEEAKSKPVYQIT